MALQPQLPTTQRAYTLRLRCADPLDSSWRDALWATHEAVNKGTKLFGDWLLTFRGGLCHTLVDMNVPAKGKKPARKPTDKERRGRRILLALSWLSVEDERGAPNGEGVRVATGHDVPSKRGEALKTALREILKKRKVDDREIKVWLDECVPSLEARIREDAVWVNRSKCFDAAAASTGGSLTREEAWDFLEPFFGSREAYFAGLDDNEEQEEEPAPQDEKAKDLVQKAGQWLSARFGTGEGADFQSMVHAYDKMASWASRADSGHSGAETIKRLAAHLGLPADSRDLNGVLGLISGPGYKSATRNHLKGMVEKSKVAKQDLDRLKELAEQDAGKCRGATGRKGRREWADKVLKDVEEACGFTYLQKDGPARHREFAVMLDHAARRVSIAHSWIKRAEQRRQKFEEDAQKLDGLRARAPQAAAWLYRFCKERSTATGAGADSGYRIRKRAIEGWADVVKAWGRASCKTEDDRIAAARELQSNPEIEKFGDIQLFEALAADDAACVWHEKDASVLADYVAGRSAEYDRKRFKVPAYRHPDALRHPVFCDFGKSRWSIQFACHEAVRVHAGGKRIAKGDAGWIRDRHGLRMGLWNGKGVDDADLRWSCKRLTADLALDDVDGPKPAPVARADRFGRAASSAFDHAAILNVFEEDEWNGRLQAPRVQLDRIARLEDDGKHAKAMALRRRLRWLVSFSPRLTPAGPFIEFAKAQGIAIKTSRKNEWYPQVPENEGRERLGKLILPRVPGLRVLSVDLGHRFAAACSVWETLSPAAFEKETAGLKVLTGGTGDEDLYLLGEKPGSDGKPRTVVYRRIGSGGSKHPAPWARLDRQFLVKLQGEEEPARWAARHETDMVRAWEKILSRAREESLDPLPHRVDHLMSDAVTLLRRALRRHGDRARIAFNLTASEKLIPGVGYQSLDRDGRVDLLTQTLILWHGLFSGKRWTDPWAANEWKKRGLSEVAMPEEAEEGSGATRRARRKALEDALKPQAQKLADQDLSKWSDAWAARWKKDDEAWFGKNGILRTLKRWVAPRGLRPLAADDQNTLTQKKAKRAAARHMGGLSLTRINTISGLYQILKAFKMRPEPDDPRKNIPKKGDDELADFNRRLLDMRDRLREQRVKQLASRIIEAALGIGRVKTTGGWKSSKRPRRAVDVPCHAVVIESLTHYRPDDLRTRRENRQLMQWSSAKVQKYLKEACQLYGLHLREVQAGYTSRQDSRTGAPGIRCQDVPVTNFMQSPFWRKQVAQAEKKKADGKGDAREQLLCELNARWKDKAEADWKAAQPLRIPLQWGKIFVSADSCSPTANGLQADLNAAANIGLKALLDPDFPAKWWYIPCDPRTFKPIKEKTKGCQAIDADKPLKSPPAPEESKGETKKGNKARTGDREVVNLWRDACTRPLSVGPWYVYQEYKNLVQSRVVNQILRPRNGLK